jgi:heme/copper-type cytochrome/quinol oxidase subunit 4
MQADAKEREELVKEYKKYKREYKISLVITIGLVVCWFVIALTPTPTTLSVVIFLVSLVAGFVCLLLCFMFYDLKRGAQGGIEDFDRQEHHYLHDEVVGVVKVAGYGICELVVTGQNRSGDQITTTIELDAEVIELPELGGYFNVPSSGN